MANEVTIEELESAIAEGKFVVDVREDYEFEAGHVHRKDRSSWRKIGTT
jgi:rhodanese-related sulfurtransferase